MLFTAFFPVDAVKENANTPFPEWTEGFEFPPALLKLRATVEGAIIPLYHQGCIAINTRGATTYGTKRTRLRRMILHIQHHENHLLTVLADSVSARIFTENTDPLDIFLQTRPFSGSLPRRVGFWTTTDRQQQQVLRVDTQPTAQAPPQRHTERTHHQIESAYMQECKVCTLWYRKLNKQWTICLKMCRVPSSLPLQTCTPSCVA